LYHVVRTTAATKRERGPHPGIVVDEEIVVDEGMVVMDDDRIVPLASVFTNHMSGALATWSKIPIVPSVP
jgi:hypothetical protein